MNIIYIITTQYIQCNFQTYTYVFNLEIKIMFLLLSYK